MLGSTVALGDDFVAMVAFSEMLGSTLDTFLLPVYVAIPQVQLLDNFVCPDPEVHHSGGAAVAVPFQGRQHPR